MALLRILPFFLFQLFVKVFLKVARGVEEFQLGFRELIFVGLVFCKFHRANQVGGLEQSVFRRLNLAKFNVGKKRAKNGSYNFCKFRLSVVVINNLQVKRIQIVIISF